MPKTINEKLIEIEQPIDFDHESTENKDVAAKYNALMKGLGDKYLKSLAQSKPKLSPEAQKKIETKKEEKRVALMSVLFPNSYVEDSGITELSATIASAESFINNTVLGAQCYAYAGFDPEKMLVQLAACQQNYTLFIRDMITMLAIFFIRGTNIDKIPLKTNATEAEIDEFKRMVALYNIKSRAKTNDDVTLSRITIIFPGLSKRVRDATQYPNLVVKGSDLGLANEAYQEYTYNYTLFGMTESPADEYKLLMYVLYQSALAKKINKNKKFTTKHLDDAYNYATIGIRQKKDIFKSMTNHTCKMPLQSDCLTALAYVLNKSDAGLLLDEELGKLAKAFNSISRERATKRENERTVVSTIDIEAKMREMS